MGSRGTRQLAAYKGIVPRWQRWTDVVAACQSLADAVIDRLGARP